MTEQPTPAPAPLMRRHLAIVHPSRPELLALHAEDGTVHLPYVDEPNGDPRSVGPIADHLGTGLRLASLGELAFYWPDTRDDNVDDVASEYLMLCEFHPAPPDGVLDRFEWVDTATASEVQLRSEPKDALLELVKWLSGDPEVRADATFALLPPHCLPGATAVLENHSGKDLHGCQQLQSWVLSSVWLDETTVTKVTCPIWPQEPSVTAYLHQIAPSTVPAVVKHGAFRVPTSKLTGAWMVTERYALVDEALEPPPEAVLQALANLQAAAYDHEPELREAGVTTRGPLEVAADLNTLWEEAGAAGLPEEECRLLPALDALLRRRLLALARTAPLVLTHGDLHTGNVLLTPHTDATYEQPGSRLVIFDWTDAALSWPGVDLLTLAGLDGEPQTDDLRQLKSAYLAAVRSVLVSPRQAHLLGGIEASIDEGTDLALAYHAVSYAHIIRSVPRRQKPFVGTRFLVRAVRQLLKQLDG